MGKAAQSSVTIVPSTSVLGTPGLPSSWPGHLPVCVWAPFWRDAALLHHDIFPHTPGAWAGKELHMQARIRGEHVWKCGDVLKSAELTEFAPERLGTSQGHF